MWLEGGGGVWTLRRAVLRSSTGFERGRPNWGGAGNSRQQRLGRILFPRSPGAHSCCFALLAVRRISLGRSASLAWSPAWSPAIQASLGGVRGGRLLRASCRISAGQFVLNPLPASAAARKANIVKCCTQGQKKREQTSKKRTTLGIRRSSPTRLLIQPFRVYQRESGRDLEFSWRYDRTWKLVRA